MFRVYGEESSASTSTIPSLLWFQSVESTTTSGTINYYASDELMYIIDAIYQTGLFFAYGAVFIILFFGIIWLII